MSTATPVPPAPAGPPTLDLAKSGPTPFGRLVAVEWRKMVDTRSGLWLLAITGGLLALVMFLVVLVVGLNDGQVTANGLTQVFTFPVSILVPVFGILVVTGEWSQRNALTTFTLEPHRMRVMGAKLVAVSTMAVGTILLAFVFGALTNVLCGVVTGNPLEWELDGSQMFWVVVAQLAFFAMGYALACLLLNTPGAIALFYVVALVLPIVVWSPLYFIFDWAKDVLPWIDINTALTPLMAGTNFAGETVEVEAINYLQAGWTIVLWVGIPVTLGLWRILRAEVK